MVFTLGGIEREVGMANVSDVLFKRFSTVDFIADRDLTELGNVVYMPVWATQLDREARVLPIRSLSQQVETATIANVQGTAKVSQGCSCDNASKRGIR